MHNHLIEIAKGSTQTASSKARNDVTRIVEDMGFSTTWISITDSSRYLDLIGDIVATRRQLKRALKTIETGSLLLVQYPWDSQTYGFARKIRSVARSKRVTTVALIHDLNGLRTQSPLGKRYYDLVVREYAYLDCFDYVICHNDTMAEHLCRRGIAAEKLIVLGLFDYLLDDDAVPARVEYRRSITIAGNLSVQKAPYIRQLSRLQNRTYDIELYGVGYEGEPESERIFYRGSFDPEVLPSHLDHGFGLVWDGDSLDGCSGALGDYERINCPHKLSLYLACGMPVIVWSGAATAGFVRKQGVGIVIDSLRDLEEAMGSTDEREYESYAAAARSVGKGLIKGERLRQALHTVSTGGTPLSTQGVPASPR